MDISFFEILIFLLIFVVPVYLGAKILKKSGHDWRWAFIMAIPLINLIMLWVYAYSDWPCYKKQQDS